MLNNIENKTVDSTNIENQKINSSSGTGVAGSLIFMGVMIIFMIILSHFMN